ncbi:hypothetical protein [Ahrensia sp. R2A130]|uniref:hypothetical protein n=1 Tax=Ahrensia sp. R2A130 TaxID=744979 RepID=UPI0001E09CC8|nr:hypothetical protein [Ahrensia sp. R2A130]EFL88224.1 hypothetical protein R2A130_2043 [Ahrensia sp. R2A130]
MNTHVATDWDPFEGSVPAGREEVREPKGRVRVPGWVAAGGIVGALIGFVVLFSYTIFDSENVLFTGLGFIFCGFLMAFGAEKAMKSEQWKRWTYFRVARDNNWSFRLVKKPVTRESDGANRPVNRKAVWQAKQTAKGMGMDPGMADKLSGFAISVGAKERVYDPLIAQAYRKIGQLMASRPGQLIPIDIEALFRGRTKGGTPFWLGAQMAKTVMVGASKTLKTDARGNSEKYGHGVAMVLGFPLNRDTGITAELLAEAIWDSREDFDTESTEFNDLFRIRLLSGDGGEADLLRVLSPATQTAMIDLATRYKAQFMIRGEHIFMSGHDLVNIEDAETIADLMAETVDDFANAATSFKAYAE